MSRICRGVPLVFLLLALKVSSIVPIVQSLLFQNIIDLHRHEPKTAPELLCAIDGDEAGSRVMLGDGQQLVNALPPKAASLELGQNCEIVETVLVQVGG